jgi:hypothetical protein
MTTLLLIVSAASATPPEAVKAPGNLPVLTASELAAEDAARQTCLAACADDGCREACWQAHPIRQVEVVPDAPQREPAGQPWVTPWPGGRYVVDGELRGGSASVAIPPGASPSSDGSQVVYVHGATVRVAPVGGPASASWDLPEIAEDGATFLVGFVDDTRVYAHATHLVGAVDACWILDTTTGAWSTPPACLEHDFYLVTELQRGPGAWWVTHSYGEGTPAVTVQRYDGGRAEVVAVPWDDLYPWGEALPSFVGEEIWWTSDCDLTRARPCAWRLEDGAAEPTRWRTYRWKPGSARVRPVKGDVAPGSSWIDGPDGPRLVEP